MAKRQKTWEAVVSLIGARPLRQRLADAGLWLVILQSSSDGLEESFNIKVVRILNQLTCNGTTDLERGCADLLDDEAEAAAKDILALFVDAFASLISEADSPGAPRLVQAKELRKPT